MRSFIRVLFAKYNQNKKVKEGEINLALVKKVMSLRVP
jgi:hypothetical protein